MSNQERLVHLVDDDEAVRRSTGLLLRTSGYAVKTYASGVELLDPNEPIAPGCIILDIRMPEIDGLTVQRLLKERGILHPVIVMTGHGDAGTAVQAMQSGAIDFLEKPFERSALMRAVEDAFAELEQAEHRHARSEKARARLDALTEKECEVLEGLARGQANRTIATELDISPRTVEIHRANLMTKLDVASLPDALRIAFAAGLGAEAGEPV